MIKPGKGFALVAMLLSSIAWGSAFVGSKVCLQWFTPYSLLKYRLLISTLTLFMIVLLTRRSLKVKKEKLPLLAVAGAVGVFGYYLLQNISLVYISSSAASIIMGTIPLLSVIAASAVHRVRLGRRMIFAAALSAAGIVLAVGLQGVSFDRGFWLGMLLMVLACAFWVGYGMLSAKLILEEDGIVMTFYQVLAAQILCWIFFPKDTVVWADVGVSGMLYLLLLGGICSGVCYVLYNIAVKALSVTVSNILMNTIPLVTILIEAIAAKKMPNPLVIAGALLVLAAVTIAMRPGPEKRRQ